MPNNGDRFAGQLARRAAAGCRLLAGIGSFLLTATVLAAPPAWLLADAQLPPLDAQSTASAEVLRDETIVTVGTMGEWIETQRYSVRVRAPDGANAASMVVAYIEKSDRITDAKAWLVAPEKKRSRVYPRSEWRDMAAMNQTSLYTDFRQFGHLSGGSSDVIVGDVYGAEVTVVRRHNAGQMQFSVGGIFPLRRGGLEFRVPPGWTPDLFWLHGRGPQPTISPDRTVWRWVLEEVPMIKSEAWTPPLAGRYIGSVIVRPADRAVGVYPQLKTWGDFARWNEGMQNPQCDTSPALQELVAKLTAGLTEPWARIEALTRYAQKQTYIQQYENSGLGFGYRPRLASVVLATGYGDCKDKANLLRAMLREAGYQSFFSVVRVSPGYEVNPEWPGQQFNHAIVAILLPAGVEHPAAVPHPVFGRLLYFDPTNPWVPLGQLPWYEHGIYTLICDSRETGLSNLPKFPAEQAWRSEAQVDLEMRSAELVQGVVIEYVAGEPAAQARRRTAEFSPTKQRQFWSDRLKKSLNGVNVGDPQGQELRAGTYQTEVVFAARSFGQWAQDKLFVVRLDMLARDTVPTFANRSRVHPVLVKPVSDHQVVRLALPTGLSVAELPVAQHVQSEFGNYEGVYSVVDGWLVFRRSLTLHHATIAPDKYRALHEFLLAVAKAEATSVALVRTVPLAKPSAESMAPPPTSP